jgi:hypothetical protein
MARIMDAGERGADITEGAQGVETSLKEEGAAAAAAAVV